MLYIYRQRVRHTLFAAMLFGICTLVSCSIEAGSTDRSTSEKAGPAPPSPTATESPTPRLDDGQGIDQTVRIELTSGSLVITNQTPETIYVEVIPQDVLPLIEWAPCESPDECKESKVDSGQTIHIELSKVLAKETEILTVYSWSLIKSAEGDRYQVTNLVSQDISVQGN